MSSATLIPLLAAPRRVDVKAIDRELAELWRAAAARSEAERIALSRARTLTLAGYAPPPAADGGARPDHAHPRGARGLVARAGTALRRVAGGTNALAGGAAFHPRRRAVAGDAGGPARPRHPRLPARGVARAAPRRGAPVHAERHRESSGAERRGDLLHRAQRRCRQRHRRRRE